MDVYDEGVYYHEVARIVLLVKDGTTKRYQWRWKRVLDHSSNVSATFPLSVTAEMIRHFQSQQIQREITDAITFHHERVGPPQARPLLFVIRDDNAPIHARNLLDSLSQLSVSRHRSVIQTSALMTKAGNVRSPGENPVR
jgi:hypothetical protein